MRRAVRNRPRLDRCGHFGGIVSPRLASHRSFLVPPACANHASQSANVARASIGVVDRLGRKKRGQGQACQAETRAGSKSSQPGSGPCPPGPRPRRPHPPLKRRVGFAPSSRTTESTRLASPERWPTRPVRPSTWQGLPGLAWPPSLALHTSTRSGSVCPSVVVPARLPACPLWPSPRPPPQSSYSTTASSHDPVFVSAGTGLYLPLRAWPRGFDGGQQIEISAHGWPARLVCQPIRSRLSERAT
ncbi:uncharacterized protein PSFLO_06362 [Pseudozyma flocculosa]|uniref:Uncharacterized protein n=1 Tax=Pseudozyma flocculosa TaxID=84751 RepID=A0A5C3F9J3_9BASI|nr:uncharacterized protein PSFLO_06362 [Pseudozyma flocculosa]